MRPTSDRKIILQRFPGLRDLVPWVDLGRFPTPVQRLRGLEAASSARAGLWIKRDDQSGDVYGSNKVRKLEILLAEAIRQDKRRVLAAGALGSNHVVATILYAKRLSLSCTCVLYPQAIGPRPLRNLKTDLFLSDHVLLAPSVALLPFYILLASWQDKIKENDTPLRIPMGGSGPVSSLGLAEGVLELEAQVKNGELPEPDFIVLPFGSCGTAAGVALGLALTGMKSRLVAVRVVDRVVSNRWRACRMANGGLAVLRRADPALRVNPVQTSDIQVVHHQFGRGYAFWTDSGRAAVQLMKESEGLQLEGTYTGKALACALDMARDLPAGKNILFWNTFSSVFPPDMDQADGVILPDSMKRILARCPDGETGRRGVRHF